ncbi:hypothetical protein CTAYLR_006641 [Chrysophaeum taylorii]|uniref:ATP-dependent Clp protease proteolytic subunit n=1 Tax=Chrysophaeum taylorii TaxID=2483200 RepID=A0AAD7UKS2_9STRA|nr:hypothetical protein CTAYLR_006641 [Chrysophaeum taylorii]
MMMLMMPRRHVLLCSVLMVTGVALRHGSGPLLTRASSTTGRRRQQGASRGIVMMPQNVPQVPYQPPGTDQHMFVDIYQRLYRDRILLVGNFLDEEQCNTLVAVLLYLKYENPNKPISIYMNVPGALMKPCLAVYDTIQQLSCPVSTINLGLCTGMSAFLCSAGTKGMRYSLPNARFLMQRTGLDDPYQGTAADIGLVVKENLRDNDRVEKALAQMTGQSIETIKRDMQRDFYLSAYEAVQYGLIDKVLIPQTGGFNKPEKGLNSIEFA